MWKITGEMVVLIKRPSVKQCPKTTENSFRKMANERTKGTVPDMPIRLRKSKNGTASKQFAPPAPPKQACCFEKYSLHKGAHNLLFARRLILFNGVVSGT